MTPAAAAIGFLFKRKEERKTTNGPEFTRIKIEAE